MTNTSRTYRELNDPDQGSSHSLIVMEARYIFVSGPWQLLVASAGLSQVLVTAADRPRDVLCITYNVWTDVERRDVECLAYLCGAWDEIHWLTDCVCPSLPSDDAVPYGMRCLRDFAEEHGHQLVEVWLAGLHRQSDKIILNAFPEIPVVLYEDGLATYTDQEITCGWKVAGHWDKKWYGRIKRTLWHGLGRNTDCLVLNGVCSKDQIRVKAVHMAMENVLGVPAYLSRCVRSDVAKSLVGLIQQISKNYDVGKSEEEGPVALLLGQKLAQMSIMSEWQEIDLYLGIARHLKARGLKVLWKDHPRNTGGISQAMRRSEISCVPDSFRYLPAEIIACVYEISFCFGGLSSSLLYMDYLLGWKTYTYLDRQWLSSMNTDDQQVSRLVMAHVDSF